jgi:hypothetical protein
MQATEAGVTQPPSTLASLLSALGRVTVTVKVLSTQSQ